MKCEGPIKKTPIIHPLLIIGRELRVNLHQANGNNTQQDFFMTETSSIVYQAGESKK
jgi:hypothetical protein